MKALAGRKGKQLMFGRPDVFATVNGFNVRVKDEREQDKNHLVEATFEVPLTFDMMDEISPAIARDLFEGTKDGHIARPELNGADLNLAPEVQIVQLKNHPELEPDVKIAGVTLRRIKARKAEAGTWLLLFTATWTLGDPREVVVMIQRLKQGVYLTFNQQEPKLDLQGDATAEAGSTAEVDRGGNVTSITAGGGRRGRRGRKGKTDTPEAIAEDQEDAAKALGDEPAGPADSGDATTEGPIH